MLINYIYWVLSIKAVIPFLDFNNGDLTVISFKIHWALGSSLLFMILGRSRPERSRFRPQVIQLKGIINSGSVKGRTPSLDKIFVALFCKLRLQRISGLIKALVIIRLIRILNILDPRLGLSNLGLEIVDFPPKFIGEVHFSVKLFREFHHLAFGGHQPSLSTLMSAFGCLNPG